MQHCCGSVLQTGAGSCLEEARRAGPAKALQEVRMTTARVNVQDAYETRGFVQGK